MSCVLFADENTASSMCYTSGTTGNPKGVVYSHRSTVIHSSARLLIAAVVQCSLFIVHCSWLIVDCWLLAHRAVMAMSPDALGLCSADSALIIVPLFHANAWGPLVLFIVSCVVLIVVVAGIPYCGALSDALLLCCCFCCLMLCFVCVQPPCVAPSWCSPVSLCCVVVMHAVG